MFLFRPWRTLANTLIGQNIEMIERNVLILQDVHYFPRETAARDIGTAFHEQNHIALGHETTEPFLKLLFSFALLTWFWGNDGRRFSRGIICVRQNLIRRDCRMFCQCCGKRRCICAWDASQKGVTLG